MPILLEKDFQSLFSPWVEKHFKTCAYELKISHGNTIAFSAFEDQQLPSLWKTYNTGKNIKLTDASYGMKPYDGVVLVKEDAYVGIMFNIPDNQSEFFLIHINEVVKIRQSGAKSIKKKDCENVGMRFSF